MVRNNQYLVYDPNDPEADSQVFNDYDSLAAYIYAAYKQLHPKGENIMLEIDSYSIDPTHDEKYQKDRKQLMSMSVASHNRNYHYLEELKSNEDEGFLPLESVRYQTQMFLHEESPEQFQEIPHTAYYHLLDTLIAQGMDVKEKDWKKQQL